MTSEYPECDMLDALTSTQRYFMFQMAPPTFQSKVAQHMDASSFGHPLKTLPMVHGSEQGLGEYEATSSKKRRHRSIESYLPVAVLYERFSTDKEQSGIKALARPKPNLARAPVSEQMPSRTQERLEVTRQKKVRDSSQVPHNPHRGPPMGPSHASPSDRSGSGTTGTSHAAGGRAGISVNSGEAAAVSGRVPAAIVTRRPRATGGPSDPSPSASAASPHGGASLPHGGAHQHQHPANAGTSGPQPLTHHVGGGEEEAASPPVSARPRQVSKYGIQQVLKPSKEEEVRIE